MENIRTKYKYLFDAFKIVLSASPCNGINCYFYKIYGSEEVSHRIFVDVIGDDVIKEFSFEQIDDAIWYFVERIASMYYKN